jgi:hypothetical protein
MGPINFYTHHNSSKQWRRKMEKENGEDPNSTA